MIRIALSAKAAYVFARHPGYAGPGRGHLRARRPDQYVLPSPCRRCHVRVRIPGMRAKYVCRFRAEVYSIIVVSLRHVAAPGRPLRAGVCRLALGKLSRGLFIRSVSKNPPMVFLLLSVRQQPRQLWVAFGAHLNFELLAVQGRPAAQRRIAPCTARIADLVHRAASRSLRWGPSRKPAHVSSSPATPSRTRFRQ